MKKQWNTKERKALDVIEQKLVALSIPERQAAIRAETELLASQERQAERRAVVDKQEADRHNQSLMIGFDRDAFFKMFSKPSPKWPITNRVLIQRINRSWKKDHKRLCVTRSRWLSTLGQYHVLNVYQNVILETDIDLALLAPEFMNGREELVD